MSMYAKKKIKGATMIEYVLIASLIALAAIAFMTGLGDAIKTKLTQIQAGMGS